MRYSTQWYTHCTVGFCWIECGTQEMCCGILLYTGSHLWSDLNLLWGFVRSSPQHSSKAVVFCGAQDKCGYHFVVFCGPEIVQHICSNLQSSVSTIQLYVLVFFQPSVLPIIDGWEPLFFFSPGCYLLFSRTVAWWIPTVYLRPVQQNLPRGLRGIFFFWLTLLFDFRISSQE